MRGRERWPGALRCRDSSAGCALVLSPYPGLCSHLHPSRRTPSAALLAERIATLRGAGPGVRGCVNTSRPRTGNTCEAVSTRPPPRLQTAHLHRTSNFYSPRPPPGGRVRALPAGRGKSRGIRSGGLAPGAQGGAASPHGSERTPRSRPPACPAGVKSARLG